MGQFERTLIIIERIFLHYVEGCTAPLHILQVPYAAVVEIFIKENARFIIRRFKNWSTNVYNLVTNVQ